MNSSRRSEEGCSSECASKPDTEAGDLGPQVEQAIDHSLQGVLQRPHDVSDTTGQKDAGRHTKGRKSQGPPHTLANAGLGMREVGQAPGAKSHGVHGARTTASRSSVAPPSPAPQEHCAISGESQERCIWPTASSTLLRATEVTLSTILVSSVPMYDRAEEARPIWSVGKCARSADPRDQRCQAPKLHRRPSAHRQMIMFAGRAECWTLAGVTDRASGFG